MAKDLECRKGCGKKFSLEGWRAKHEEGCDGEPKRAAAAAAKTARRARSAPKDESAIDRALVELRMERTDLTDRVAALDKVIEAIEGLEGK